MGIITSIPIGRVVVDEGSIAADIDGTIIVGGEGTCVEAEGEHMSTTAVRRLRVAPLGPNSSHARGPPKQEVAVCLETDVNIAYRRMFASERIVEALTR